MLTHGKLINLELPASIHYKVVCGMELYDRVQERTHRGYHNDPRRDFFANGGFSFHNISTASDSDENLAHKKGLKEHSSLYTFIWTLLFVVVLIVENISHFKLFENCQTSIIFYWLESCVIALFFRFWGRKRVRRYVKYKLKVLGYYLGRGR